MGEEKKSNSLVIGAMFLTILALAYGLFRYVKKEDGTVVNTQEQVKGELAFVYKDGTYTSKGNYSSPGGDESVNVTLVIKEDVITEATFAGEATRPISVTMQAMFTANFRPLVLGKKLDEVVLDKVSGSSLTPKGWNDAVTKIIASARI